MRLATCFLLSVLLTACVTKQEPVMPVRTEAPRMRVPVQQAPAPPQVAQPAVVDYECAPEWAAKGQCAKHAKRPAVARPAGLPPIPLK